MIRSDSLVISDGHRSQASRELEADLAREIAGEVRFDGQQLVRDPLGDGRDVRPGRADLGSRRVAGDRDLRRPADAGRRDVRGRARPPARDIAMAIGERVLLPAVRGERLDSPVIADGFSCREQIRHGTGRTALHSAEVIALALRTMCGLVVEQPGTPARQARAAGAARSSPGA
jgi:hypothetical protein